MADFVVPGQPITSEAGYLRGHGAYIRSGEGNEQSTESGAAGGGTLFASVAGRIERVNKLITVKAPNSRYTGEVGDLVVGRIATVDSKRWKVDIHAQRDALLPLSSINLASGEQRMKTYEDQLSMRTLFEEGDLICAEIQNLNTDGVISLHSRSLKYGKLENGQLVVVPASLVRRMPQHYVSLSYGVDVILGKNGYIWVTRSIPEAWKQESDDMRDDITPLAETLQRIRLRHASTPLTLEDRLKVVRTRNAVAAIALAAELGGAEAGADAALTVSPETVTLLYHKSIELKMQPADMLQAQCALALAACIK